MDPRYFQRVERSPKIRMQLGGLSHQRGLIRDFYGNCTGGHGKRHGCLKECLKVEKPYKT